MSLELIGFGLGARSTQTQAFKNIGVYTNRVELDNGQNDRRLVEIADGLVRERRALAAISPQSPAINARTRLQLAERQRLLDVRREILAKARRALNTAVSRRDRASLGSEYIGALEADTSNRPGRPPDTAAHLASLQSRQDQIRRGLREQTMALRDQEAAGASATQTAERKQRLADLMSEYKQKVAAHLIVRTAALPDAQQAGALSTALAAADRNYRNVRSNATAPLVRAAELRARAC